MNINTVQVPVNSVWKNGQGTKRRINFDVHHQTFDSHILSICMDGTCWIGVDVWIIGTCSTLHCQVNKGFKIKFSVKPNSNHLDKLELAIKLCLYFGLQEQQEIQRVIYYQEQLLDHHGWTRQGNV